MDEKIMHILAEVCGAEPEELAPDIDLFEEGLLDSFGVVQLLVALEEQLGITLDIAAITQAEIATPTLLVQRVEAAR